MGLFQNWLISLGANLVGRGVGSAWEKKREFDRLPDEKKERVWRKASIGCRAYLLTAFLSWIPLAVYYILGGRSLWSLVLVPSGVFFILLVVLGYYKE